MGSSALGSSALASSALASSAFGWAFLAARFLGVVASLVAWSSDSLATASKVSFLDAPTSLTRRVPSEPGRPLNLCQSPVTLRIASTCSDGCAPTPSQYCARSELTSIREGSSVGWYLPISSMARPSRLVRESATTMR